MDLNPGNQGHDNASVPGGEVDAKSATDTRNEEKMASNIPVDSADGDEEDVSVPENQQSNLLPAEDLIGDASAQVQSDFSAWSEEQKGNDEESKTDLLACDNCKFPIVKRENILRDSFPTWNEAVMRYELNVLDDDINCYSATNPEGHRFDLLRIDPTLSSIAVHGKATAEHSWFPGYAWQAATCAACDVHLGWGFTLAETDKKVLKDANASDGNNTDLASNVLDQETPPNTQNRDETEQLVQPQQEEEQEQQEQIVTTEEKSDTNDQGSSIINQDTDSPSLEFFSLILTKLTPTAYSSSEMNQFDEDLDALLVNADTNRSQLQELYALLNSMPLSMSGALHPIVFEMMENPRLRSGLPNLLNDVRNVIGFANLQLHEGQQQPAAVVDPAPAEPLTEVNGLSELMALQQEFGDNVNDEDEYFSSDISDDDDMSYSDEDDMDDMFNDLPPEIIDELEMEALDDELDDYIGMEEEHD